MLRREREHGRGKLIVILVCIAGGTSIGLWHNHQVARGRSDIVTVSVRTVSAPFVSAFGASTRWFGGQISWLWRGRSLDEENRRLRAENQALRESNATLIESSITAQRLRAQLGFESTAPKGKIAADIVSFRPNPRFETMVIGRGSRDGVHLKSVVVTPRGLVGQVFNITPTTADVLLLTDSEAAVGSMDQRPESRARGVCKGNGGPRLTMAYVDGAADIKVGDTIISSGMGGAGGVFPKGIPIGAVASVSDDASGSTKRIAVRPAVDFERLEEVYVLP